MSNLGRWERQQRQLAPLSPRAQPNEFIQPRKQSRTASVPLVTTSDIQRYVAPTRPASSGDYTSQTHRSRQSDTFSSSITPLHEFRHKRQWPPRGYTKESVLSPEEAEDLVCAGASTFKGYVEAIPYAPDKSRFFAVMESEHCARTDRAKFGHNAFKDMSLSLNGAPETEFPWSALEQPCMAYCFGTTPGTMTLNFRVSKSGCTKPSVQYGAHIKTQPMKLLNILERLRQLESGGLDTQDPDALYNYLYGKLIEDSEKKTNPHRGMEAQIADLITVLGNSDWIDFSSPRHQVTAKYFDSAEPVRKQQFFHQLLLSVELYLRIHSREHTEKAKKRLIAQLPPKHGYDLAVAQRWLENMSISKEKSNSRQSTFSFDLLNKRRQKEALLIFAETLKWPNLNELGYVLAEKDPTEKSVEDRSGDAMSWFTGVVLPGHTMPWVLMNSVIDCDKDTGETLKYLSHMNPASGFQYRAITYWAYECIVGKVLGAARGTRQIAGWIGPCMFTPDLKRTECIRIRQLESPELKLTPVDVEKMKLRTEPLGPEDDAYPLDDYELVLPDVEDVTDAIRVEKLSFKVVAEQPKNKMGPGAPMFFDAAVIFACGGDSWPMRLKYNVDFIAAYPCFEGPHVLFYDYAYRAIKIDGGLVDTRDWAEQSRGSSASTGQQGSHGSRPSSASGGPAYYQINKVLAIEAFGVSDNAVFARAWCASNGHSAIVADVNETCMACAIREAYAACVSVVILTEGGVHDQRDEHESDPVL